MIISPRHKQVILNLKNPNRVLQAIPSARVFSWKGQQLVAVPHRLEETRVLRYIGLFVPAPIEQYYSWPGRQAVRAPEGHASFLTLEPGGSFLLGAGHGQDAQRCGPTTSCRAAHRARCWWSARCPR
jgi:hypothetical protein